MREFEKATPVKFDESVGHSAEGSTLTKQFEPQGSSGTEITGGVYSEEYLSTLQGMDAAKVWDTMRRSETQVAMLLNAVFNPIKAANWDVESADASNPEYEKHAAFIKKAFFKKLDWSQFTHEALTFVIFGHSVFEEVHVVELSDVEFGQAVFLKALGFRSPKTILEWNLEKKTGRLIQIRQQSTGDVADNAVIPGEFLTVFTLNKEGDNYEGISALRPMYGAYNRKKLYLKLLAIGLEKYAVGVPIGTIPKDKVNVKKEVEDFKKVLQSYASHEKAYLTKPEGWEIEVQRNEFAAEKVVEVIKLENQEMVNVLVANFLSLGTGGNGGAYSLGTDLSAFFLGCIQAFADNICLGLQRKTIKKLIDINFGPQAEYPKMKCTGINDKAGKEFADVVKALVDARVIAPDETLEEFLRKQFKLPAKDKATAVVLPAMPAQSQKFSETFKFADTYKRDWNENKSALKTEMQSSLEQIWEAWKKRIESKFNNTSEAQRLTLPKQVVTPGVAAYKKTLRTQLAQVALDSLDAARKEVPTKKKIKLAEQIDTLKFANITDPFDKLPSALKKRILAQADLIAETQIADLEKAVYFQFTSSAGAGASIELILKDLDGVVDPIIAGSTKAGTSLDAAAGDAVAVATQAGRNEFFFQPEVLDEVESFTFYNEDPVSEICQDLNGQTFLANDPEAQRYFPPLHHNCKSRLVPNLKGDKGNPEPTKNGFGPSSKDLEKFITLHEGTCACYKLFDAQP